MKWYFLLVGIALIGQARAQDTDPINAERPGFSSSPFVLAPSTLQIESGYQYTRESGQTDFDDHTLPQLLFRAGLSERLELQLGWAGYSWTDAGGNSVNGTNDASVGLKWQVTDAGASVPVALFAGLSLPVGNDEFSSNKVDPTVGAFWSHSAGLDWFGTVVFSEADNDTSLSNAVGISLPVDQDKGAYVEYFGNYGGNAGPEHYLNGGLTYVPVYNVQFDVHAGLGLNSRAADFFIGFGLACRF
jgi:hypothetical protein